MAYHQLLSLLSLIYFASAAVFVGARVIMLGIDAEIEGGNARALLTTVIALSGMAWMRLLIKIGMARRITIQVRQKDF